MYFIANSKYNIASRSRHATSTVAVYSCPTMANKLFIGSGVTQVSWKNSCLTSPQLLPALQWCTFCWSSSLPARELTWLRGCDRLCENSRRQVRQLITQRPPQQVKTPLFLLFRLFLSLAGEEQPGEEPQAEDRYYCSKYAPCLELYDAEQV